MAQQKQGQRQKQLQQEQDSIWYFRQHEFKELIQGIEDKTITVELLL
jgi:hypothetical protein